MTKLKTFLTLSALAVSAHSGANLEIDQESSQDQAHAVRVSAERLRSFDQQPESVTFSKGAFDLVDAQGKTHTIPASHVKGVPTDLTEDQFQNFIAHGFLKVTHTDDDYDLEATIDGKGGGFWMALFYGISAADSAVSILNTVHQLSSQEKDPKEKEKLQALEGFVAIQVSGIEKSSTKRGDEEQKKVIIGKIEAKCKALNCDLSKLTSAIEKAVSPI